MTFSDAMNRVVELFEIVGVAVLAAGSALALLNGAWIAARGQRMLAYQSARQHVGRSILLGLEILIIADIVATVTIDTTLESAVILGIVVLVRTLLSFSIAIELDGVLPWRRGPEPRPERSH